ncbi:Protein of unknown function [Pyronema omphalodes CBS 100304]|uniref:Uncharacterized protein n=1 Tax=Pyronema omphalodes (strain CBS 100304) TaxID=1076935 RepID=U4LMY7_PYROM|nr:Protein of unknown function [Pyronema omphalodes CBS 100304]
MVENMKELRPHFCGPFGSPVSSGTRLRDEVGLIITHAPVTPICTTFTKYDQVFSALRVYSYSARCSLLRVVSLDDCQYRLRSSSLPWALSS